MSRGAKRPRITLLAGCLVTLALGSIHAFSVFLLPLEEHYGIDRSRASFVYSLGLLSLTAAVLLGHRLYTAIAAAPLVAFACVGAAVGLGTAGVSGTLTGLYVGYGLVFGAANGVGYGFVLQLVAQAMPRAAGLAMGTVTAFYAVGAVVFAGVFADVLRAVAETAGSHP